MASRLGHAQFFDFKAPELTLAFKLKTQNPSIKRRTAEFRAERNRTGTCGVRATVAMPGNSGGESDGVNESFLDGRQFEIETKQVWGNITAAVAEISPRVPHPRTVAKNETVIYGDWMLWARGLPPTDGYPMRPARMAWGVGEVRVVEAIGGGGTFPSRVLGSGILGSGMPDPRIPDAYTCMRETMKQWEI